MLKRNIVCFCLMVCVAAFSGAASANPPYASILAYTQGQNMQPTMNMLAVLNVINLTPWEIYIGDPTNNNDIMKGFSGSQIPNTPTAVNSFWLKGITGANDSSGGGKQATGSSGFAFHSVQIGLSNPNNSWVQSSANNNKNYNSKSIDLTGKASNTTQKPYQNYAAHTAYFSLPIVVNSTNGQQNSKTAALNFMVTGSEGFATASAMSMGKYSYMAAYALSFGDGTNNYGWATNNTNIPSTMGAPPYNSTQKVTQLLTIQAAGSQSGWAPSSITAGGSLSHPVYLNTAALMVPNFSNLSGVGVVQGISYDLVALLQSGDYANCSLIFMAVPHGAITAGQ